MFAWSADRRRATRRGRARSSSGMRSWWRRTVTACGPPRCTASACACAPSWPASSGSRGYWARCSRPARAALHLFLYSMCMIVSSVLNAPAHRRSGLDETAQTTFQLHFLRFRARAEISTAYVRVTYEPRNDPSFAWSPPVEGAVKVGTETFSCTGWGRWRVFHTQ